MTKPSPDFSIVSFSSYVVHAKNTLVGRVGPFLSTIILTVSTPNRLFLAYHILKSDYSFPVTKREQLDMN